MNTALEEMRIDTENAFVMKMDENKLYKRRLENLNLQARQNVKEQLST
jgi:hypothetical protein